MGLIFASGFNKKGIPLMLSFLNKQSNHKIWEDQFLKDKDTDILRIFALPLTVDEYTVSINNLAIGHSSSENVLSNFIFQIIPESWYSMFLVPKNRKMVGLQAVNRYKGLASTYIGRSTREDEIGIENKY